ncbi:carbohydrate esterase family 4 protein [Zopfia rhizophila CBS 207.26]|uniref:chitin deacetylase n=1 Tax=Zopfia rhizophila CBS 207.26 TaxID=1314779 RepID=A0A6A6DXW3_9PEZI|nr:carbohydrate esterase family 4 protein [Zopfia rhizophila CBS 207.26]
MFILINIMCLIIFPFYIIYKPPSLLIRYFQYRWPDVLWHVSTSSKVVALTIDDGPSEYTSQIMEILKENDAAATFFIIGSQIPGKEVVLADLVRNGNELGNHAMRDEPSRSLPDSELIHQIHTVETLIHRAYNAAESDYPPRYFRPGSGFFSQRMRERLEVLKYRLVLGNIYPHDPQIPYWRVNARHILSMLQPGGIIICHDRRSWTVPMLKKVIPEIKRRGYHITTVSGLVNQAHIQRPS